MKAAICETYGPPEAIQVVDVPKPEFCENDLLVGVCASTVNRTDTGYRSAQYFISRFFTGLFRPKHIILGTEFAGEVVCVGRNVTDFTVGDRVFGYNEKTFGCCAQYTAIPASGMVTHSPEHLGCAEIVASTEGSHYALNQIRVASIKKGDDVLVYGGSGSIGSAAIQILIAMDVTVTAVVGTSNIALMKKLGCKQVHDYQKEDFIEILHTDGVRFDLVLDAVGKITFGQCKKLLKPCGVYISTEFGPYLQNPFLAIWTRFFSKKKVLFPIPSERKSDVQYIKKLMEEGKYKPVIDRQYPLDAIANATRYVETGQKVGNVVIVIEEKKKRKVS